MNKKSMKGYVHQIELALSCMELMNDEDYKKAFNHSKEETARAYMIAIKNDFEKELNK